MADTASNGLQMALRMRIGHPSYKHVSLHNFPPLSQRVAVVTMRTIQDMHAP